MKGAIKAYQYVNILSLDVAAGAVIGSAFFAHLFGAHVAPIVYVALALTVWVVYTLDHLRDARSIPGVAATDRHQFHQQYFKVLMGLVLLITAIDAALIWQSRDRVLFPGMVLGAVVMLYLVLQRHLKFMKEVFVAALYTAGILLPVYVSGEMRPEGLLLLVILKYFVTALMNLLLFSLFDHERDRTQRQHSFVTWFGPMSTRVSIVVLGVLNIVTGFWVWSFDPLVAAIFIAMNLSLLAILAFQNRLMQRNYYRILGDGVFFLPVLYLIWAR